MAYINGSANNLSKKHNRLETAKRALDELFLHARQYRTSASFRELLSFARKFRYYSPYNAMLIHIQKPGSTFVAPPERWLKLYARRIKPEAKPLLILQPRGPIMFVFDVSDTEPVPGEEPVPIPDDVLTPFRAHGSVGHELSMTIRNACRDCVDVVEQDAGSQSAGQIEKADGGQYLRLEVKSKPKPVWTHIPIKYIVRVNRNYDPVTKYATLAHELGHLYCGHLGTPNPAWWPERKRLSGNQCEFEAESICYLVCERLGIKNPSAEYLAGYFDSHAETPQISPELVLKVAGLIESMGKRWLGLRKE
jgi:hypothetical protein